MACTVSQKDEKFTTENLVNEIEAGSVTAIKLTIMSRIAAEGRKCMFRNEGTLNILGLRRQERGHVEYLGAQATGTRAR
jgi:hypothetical protein